MAKSLNQTIKLLEWEETIRKNYKVRLERPKEMQQTNPEGKKKKQPKTNMIILDKPIIMPKLMLHFNKKVNSIKGNQIKGKATKNKSHKGIGNRMIQIEELSKAIRNRNI